MKKIDGSIVVRQIIAESLHSKGELQKVKAIIAGFSKTVVFKHYNVKLSGRKVWW